MGCLNSVVDNDTMVSETWNCNEPFVWTMDGKFEPDNREIQHLIAMKYLPNTNELLTAYSKTHLQHSVPFTIEIWSISSENDTRNNNNNNNNNPSLIFPPKFQSKAIYNFSTRDGNKSIKEYAFISFHPSKSKCALLIQKAGSYHEIRIYDLNNIAQSKSNIIVNIWIESCDFEYNVCIDDYFFIHRNVIAPYFDKNKNDNGHNNNTINWYFDNKQKFDIFTFRHKS